MSTYADKAVQQGKLDVSTGNKAVKQGEEMVNNDGECDKAMQEGNVDSEMVDGEVRECGKAVWQAEQKAEDTVKTRRNRQWNNDDEHDVIMQEGKVW